MIVGGGEFLDEELVMDLINDCDIIIAADGGGKYLYDINVLPDILVGDFDTLNPFILNYYKDTNITIYSFPPEKDKTDLELAIDCALDNHIDELKLIGVLGTRIDHSLGNIMLLFNLIEKGIDARIINDKNEIFVVNKEMIITKNRFEYVSILPILEDLKGIKLKGFEYDIDDLNLKISSTRGISNKLVNDKGIIKIKSGKGLIILSKD
nr:thiamine diphosphokinase [Anaeromonas gelatinilytica]